MAFFENTFKTEMLIVLGLQPVEKNPNLEICYMKNGYPINPGKILSTPRNTNDNLPSTNDDIEYVTQ